MVASHAPTSAAAYAAATFPEASRAVKSGVDASSLIVTGKAVAKVNGAVLTDRDLLREMFALFPYAKLHGGFPKKEEEEIRQGALQMIIFEELVYQEAVRRKMTIAPARIAREEHNFKGQFASEAEFNEYLKTELGGSEAKLRQQIKRSLLIDALLKQEVDSKAQSRWPRRAAFYEKNPKAFERGETFGLQTISIIPPDKASAQVVEDARKRAEGILAQAKATKNYEQFGLLAEKVSEDDYPREYGRPECGEERQAAAGSGEGCAEDEAGRSERADSAGHGMDDYSGECAYAAGEGDVRPGKSDADDRSAEAEIRTAEGGVGQAVAPERADSGNVRRKERSKVKLKKLKSASIANVEVDSQRKEPCQETVKPVPELTTIGGRWGKKLRERAREALNSRKYNARVVWVGAGIRGDAGDEDAAPGWAQVEIGSNTSMTLSGDLGFGYNGNYGNQIGSSHGTSVNGDAIMQGYYYNPKFLNFFVDPIYNRSQANSGQGSITDATSINAGVNLFSGSHFPGLRFVWRGLQQQRELRVRHDAGIYHHGQLAQLRHRVGGTDSGCGSFQRAVHAECFDLIDFWHRSGRS